MRHPPRGVAASGFPPLCNIPHCCLPQESGPCLSTSVADHPLKPAMCHCLGEPLPPQLADTIQSDLLAKNLSLLTLSKKEDPVLITVSSGYPRLRGTLTIYYSPVRHSTAKSKLFLFPFDLHVLSTPPAFILSQDQTLHNCHPERCYVKTVLLRITDSYCPRFKIIGYKKYSVYF